jgi:hypothetical protein
MLIPDIMQNIDIIAGKLVEVEGFLFKDKSQGRFFLTSTSSPKNSGSEVIVISDATQFDQMFSPATYMYTLKKGVSEMYVKLNGMIRHYPDSEYPYHIINLTKVKTEYQSCIYEGVFKPEEIDVNGLTAKGWLYTCHRITIFASHRANSVIELQELLNLPSLYIGKRIRIKGCLVSPLDGQGKTYITSKSENINNSCLLINNSDVPLLLRQYVSFRLGPYVEDAEIDGIFDISSDANFSGILTNITSFSIYRSEYIFEL